MKPLVKGVFTETQAQAYTRFKKQFKDSPVLDDIKPDDLPESFRVQLSDPTKYAVITSSFTGAPGVGEVQDQQRILDPLFTWLNKFTVGTLVMAALMVVCSVLLIATTIRQTAFSRRRETGIMRLVGASAFVIQLPFILETLIATLLGAGLGFGALWAAIRFGITENVAKSIPDHLHHHPRRPVDHAVAGRGRRRARDGHRLGHPASLRARMTPGRPAPPPDALRRRPDAPYRPSSDRCGKRAAGASAAEGGTTSPGVAPL